MKMRKRKKLMNKEYENQTIVNNKSKKVKLMKSNK